MNETTETTLAQLGAQMAEVRALLGAIAGHLGLDPLMVQIAPAPDSDLDSEWGDPVIDRTPKKWTLEPIEGLRFSQLAPATLRALAREYAGLARWHDEKGNVDSKGRPKGNYARRDAARALGWAQRLESKATRFPPRPRPAARPPERDNPPLGPGVEVEDMPPF